MLDLDAKRRAQIRLKAPVVSITASIVAGALPAGEYKILGQIAVMLLAAYIIQQLTPAPEKPQNAFSPDGNTVGIGQAVPIVYGKRKMFGHVIQNYIFKDDRDAQWARVLYAVSEGCVKAVGEVKINDLPADNYNPAQGGDGKVVVYTANRTGTATQGPIGGDRDDGWFNKIANSQPCGVRLDDNMDYTYVTQASDLTDFIINIEFPTGLVYVQQSSIKNLWQGGPKENNVGFKIQFRENPENCPDSEWSVPKYFRFHEAKQVRFYRQIQASRDLNNKDDNRPGAKLNPAGARYEVLIHRMTGAEFDLQWHETQSGTDENGDPTVTIIYYTHTRGDQSAADTVIDYVDEINDNARPTYPNTALLATSIRASNVLSGGYPRVSCVVDGILVKRRLDGVWQNAYPDNPDLGDPEKTWLNNPAWIVYDLMTNERYGLGAYITEDDIDLDSFEQFANYCDETVTVYESDRVTPDHTERRHTCDIVLDQRQPAWDVIRKLLASFRALLVEADGKYRIVVDQPTDVSQVFTMGNIIRGSFQTHWANLKDEYNTVEVLFDDQDRDWDRGTVRYSTNEEDPTKLPDPAKICQIELQGVTRKSEAYREANYRLNMLRRLSQSIEFDAALDAIACQVGDVIAVAHDIPQWGFSGRLRGITKGSSTATLTLDRGELPSDPEKQYEVCLRFPDDAVHFYRVASVDNSTVTVDHECTCHTPAQVMPDLPVGCSPNDVVYSYGESKKSVKLFRVMSITTNEDLTRHLTAAEYDPAVYEETPYVLQEEPSVSSLPNPFAINPASNVAVFNYHSATTDLRTVVYQQVRWTPPSDGYNHAKVWYKETHTSTWLPAGDGFDTVTMYLNPGDYEVAVCSVNNVGVEQDPDNVTPVKFTAEGKSSAPAIPAGFSATPAAGVIHLSWQPVLAVDLAGYEVYMGDAQSFIPDKDNCTNLVWRGMATTCDVAVSPTAGDRYFKLRSLDTYGTPSDYAPAGPAASLFTQIGEVVQVPARPDVPFLSTNGDGATSSITASWTAVDGATQYEVGLRESGTTQCVTQTTADTSAIFLGLKVGIKYYAAVRALNAGGASEWSPESNIDTSADLGAPPAPTSVSAYGAYSQVIVSWSAPANSSKVRGYNVYLGDSADFTPSGGTLKWSGSATICGIDVGPAVSKYVKVASISHNGVPSDAASPSPNDPVRTLQIGERNDIKSGSITSDHIVTVGLDAAVIRTGALSANRISGGTLDADNVSIEGGHGAVRLNSLGLKGYAGASETFSIGTDGMVSITSADGKTKFTGTAWEIRDENDVLRVRLGRLS